MLGYSVVPALDLQASYLRVWSNAPAGGFEQWKGVAAVKMGWSTRSTIAWIQQSVLFIPISVALVRGIWVTSWQSRKTS